MKYSYTRTRRGNSQGGSNNQQVHADTKLNGHNNLFLNPKNKIMLQKNQNTIMKTKTMSLLVLAMFGFLTLFMVGCQKDDDYPFQDQVIERYTHRHFDVVQDQKYGSYLEFKSIDDLKVVNEYLDSLETQEYSTLTGETPLTQWENTIKGFSSLRTVQKAQDFDKIYSSPAFATLLNKNGYIKVAGVLYLDKGEEVYTIVDNSEKLYFSQETNSYAETQSGVVNKAANCNWSDAEEIGEAFYCSGRPTLKTWVTIDHWTHYILGNEKIYLKSKTYAYDCRGVRSVFNFKHQGSYSYSLIRDGVATSSSGSYTITTAGEASFLLMSGGDICLNNFVKNTVKSTALASGGNIMLGQNITTTAEAY